MEFSRRKYGSARIAILSERPLFSALLEERISAILPAIEERVDSFESYVSAHEHCSANRNVGLIIFHQTAKNNFPENFVEELLAPYESGLSRGGLLIFAEDESSLAKSYRIYGSNPRLINIILEGEVAPDISLKEQIEQAWEKFESFQKEIALPKQELEFVERIAKRFENTGSMSRVVKILTNHLDKNWFDELIIESSSVILLIPSEQKWVLANSGSLHELMNTLAPYEAQSIDSLINSKEKDLIPRAAMLAKKLYFEAKTVDIVALLDEITKGTTAFSPTLKKIVQREKTVLAEILQPMLRAQSA